jgi:uncharacterized protein DUF481
LRGLAVLAVFISLETLQAQTVILHLRNGDRITGTIVSGNTNQVTLSTALIKKVIVPVAAMERSEDVPAEAWTAKPSAAPPAKPASPSSPPAKPPKHWAGEAQIGMDAVFGQKNRQLYYGRIKTTYVKDRFINIFDCNVSYRRTDGILSENRMDGSSKTDFNLGKRPFVFYLGGASHDEIRKIDLRYEN